MGDYPINRQAINKPGGGIPSGDSANQLIRENNDALNTTWTWTYDNAGNLLTAKKYAFTLAADLSELTPLESHAYNYDNCDWYDLLTSYDGVQFHSDGVGNLTYDGTWNYTWRHGRELASISNGTTTWTYTYDANGMRTKRTDGTTI